MSKWSFDLYIENTQGNEIFGNGDRVTSVHIQSRVKVAELRVGRRRNSQWSRPAWVHVPMLKLQCTPRDANRCVLVLLSIRLFANTGTLLWECVERWCGRLKGMKGNKPEICYHHDKK
jgi:hypothetical protein